MLACFQVESICANLRIMAAGQSCQVVKGVERERREMGK